MGIMQRASAGYSGKNRCFQSKLKEHEEER